MLNDLNSFIALQGEFMSDNGGDWFSHTQKNNQKCAVALDPSWNPHIHPQIMFWLTAWRRVSRLSFNRHMWDVWRKKSTLRCCTLALARDVNQPAWVIKSACFGDHRQVSDPSWIGTKMWILVAVLCLSAFHGFHSSVSWYNTKCDGYMPKRYFRIHKRMWI